MRYPVGTKALIMAAAASLLLGVTATPAMATKLSGLRGASDGHFNFKTRSARRGAYWRRGHCGRGGRHYTFLGGWGCDYYRYSWEWPKGHR